MEFEIAVLPGDGIGPEVTAEATKVLRSVAGSFGHRVNFREGLIGGAAMDAFGVALTEDTFDMARQCDAILFGSVGGPKWDDARLEVRASDGLFRLRKGMNLFANLRPVKTLAPLAASTPLKKETVEGVDLVVLRELIGGLYFGEPRKQWQTPEGRKAVDTMAYSEDEIERVVRVGFELARTRRQKLTSVDKSNVLQTSSLWRQIATELAQEYPDVELQHMYVDACAMELIRRPTGFDVMVMDNTFGDILSDEASILAGSLGLSPSASLAGTPAVRVFGLYEPIHGTAPTIEGQDVANPIGAILSAGMLLRYSCGLVEEAQAVEDAVVRVLEKGYRTDDIMEQGKRRVGTRAMGDLVARRLMEA